jgi:hypothetical protein
VPQPNAPSRTRKKNFFLYKFIQWCQPSKFSKWNLAIMLATARLYSTKHFACWYHLLTADRAIRSGPSIWFSLTSRILLRICMKSIREIIMVRNRKRNTKSFILYNERNIMWRMSEQSSDATHLASQGVLVRFLYTGGANDYAEFFIIRMFVTVFKRVCCICPGVWISYLWLLA